jgi:hypothetical protein
VVISRTTLLGLAIFACSPSPSAPSVPGPLAPATGAGELRVANGTAQPLAFFAIASDRAPLLDPVPDLDTDDPGITLVPPGEERLVGEVSGREQAPDGGVALFLYVLTDHGRRAHFTRVELATGEAIRSAGGRILIGSL